MNVCVCVLKIVLMIVVWNKPTGMYREEDYLIILQHSRELFRDVLHARQHETQLVGFLK